MGSVVVSDVATDFARFPHTMMVADHHDPTPTPERQHHAPSVHRSTSSSSSVSYSQHRFVPTAATTTTSTSTLSSQPHTTALCGNQYAHAANSIEIPGSRGTNLRAPSNAVSASPFAPPTSRPETPSQTAPHNDGDGFDRSGFPLSGEPRGLASSPPSPRLLPTIRSSLSFTRSGSASPARIKVRDLSHIQAFASEEALSRSQHGSYRPMRPDGGQQYEISEMPVTDIIEMVAGLLTKITTTNDRQNQHENIHRHIPNPDGSSAVNQQTSSVLSFHGKNVPTITILSYLSRIHKYCPTTYEVFLSLLVYFDRMTEMINRGTLASFRDSDEVPKDISASSIVTPPASGSIRPQDLVDSPDSSQHGSDGEEGGKLSHVFVVDSFNIHRLVIAGVTCASKFFSDVFYTNSRYAKASYVMRSVRDRC